MHSYFLFGNQPLEIKEMVDEITTGLIPKSDQEHAVFSFDVAEFFSREREKAKKQLSEFQNTCQTVSFFAPKIIVQVINLQKIPLKKSPTDAIIAGLKEINLVKTIVDEDSVWFDVDSSVDRMDTRHHVTGAQIVTEVIHCGGSTFYLKLEPSWANRLIYRQKGKNKETVLFKAFLDERLKGNLVFDPPEVELSDSHTGTSGVVALLKSYIENPPEQVTFIFTADIRQPREINAEIYPLLKKHTKEIKCTIAYDNFRPVSWVVARAKKKQLRLDVETADLLIEIAGTDFSVLNMELDKLALQFPPDTQVISEELLKSTSHSKRFTIFRIADFLVQKDLRKALESLEMILKDHPAESIAVFGLIASQFRRMLKISWMLEGGLSENAVISKLKINQWVAKQAVKHTRNFSLNELENIVVQLAKIDLQIKFFAKDALTIMGNICFQICQGVFADKKYIDSHWLP
ncbi:MAG: DNA polymerase III subunit delta [Deltaproteobacteria bacterium]|nr:DNA polymerase III subunit delta [Deltaproteobacteria bacterium]MBT4087692.1 DNA polymerase III subunit delta [Deltaproteobacteria bacterium]MBT4267196.1 DNA polymerase III subunit delta [Deltaproteobacteria bacterium]MBT4638041.1 DNA polymerase III subunit delta [Deltaproteobacteria bacterium]MBT6499226.1 DNA polymerase III subunit delta [Deltaproteobacteria bacterium]